jgi:diguanylate cyclase
VISLKRYIDTEHTSAGLLRAMSEAYRQTLSAVSASASQACPSVESGLTHHLTALGQEMAHAESAETIGATGARITARLQQWADRADDDLRRKTADVKELLVTLAHTAASVAASDAEHVMRFDALTARLEKVASLDDVTELRSAVLASARELRISVEELSATRRSITQMQTELQAYQARLDEAEEMAAHDALTGVLNRRKVESLIERRIQRGHAFSVGLIDLDGFKAVNDAHGHRAGDDLLKQFAADLLANSRPTDAVGRWGGDEFVVIVDAPGTDARAHFGRVQQWVAGSYTVEGARGKAKVHMDLSIGVTEWRPGMSASEMIEEADGRMYDAKRQRR